MNLFLYLPIWAHGVQSTPSPILGKPVTQTKLLPPPPPNNFFLPPPLHWGGGGGFSCPPYWPKVGGRPYYIPFSITHVLSDCSDIVHIESETGLINSVEDEHVLGEDDVQTNSCNITPEIDLNGYTRVLNGESIF